MPSHLRVPLRELREPGFRVVGIRGAIRTGHVLHVDRFRMTEPVIPPHPHAGFSALTYVLPNSPGSMMNRDSHGEHREIPPGALHFTTAGRGIVHEEVPSRRGIESHGLQIFSKLPREREQVAPEVQHYGPSELPIVERDGVTVRVIAGAYEGHVSPLRLDPPTTLLHLEVTPGASLTLSLPSHDAFALVLDGSGSIEASEVQESDACVLVPGEARIEAAVRLRLLVGVSPPLDAPVHWAGPFCFFAPERLAEAQARYRAGEMGGLEPTHRDIGP
ncbi:pirin family protein [Corallococcus sp. ZKHCc1 1396]|uniref:Pirin family protein n=1 Tax=Corallococcus soli TaxID=2710757 RepID=A0ABR9PXN1_9BACT|nr:pirin family protein [Corallococcus soli]MBE4752512.1 pirin family protein [Corallococcus soli]